MSVHSELKRLAEAFPEYDYDSNTAPFFNGPSGESLGGGSTGSYCVYGPAFEIDGEPYDGVTLVETCTADQAKFIVGAKAAVLGLLAEVEQLKRRDEMLSEFGCEYCGGTGWVTRIDGECLGPCTECPCYELSCTKHERDQFKAEVEALRKIVSESATACGAAVSPECSLEFMAGLPGEIRAVLSKDPPMTAREQIQFRRLQLENEELRQANARHIQVFGDQALELIELRAKLALLKEVVNG